MLTGQPVTGRMLTGQMLTGRLAPLVSDLTRLAPYPIYGRLVASSGGFFRGLLPTGAIGDSVEIASTEGNPPVSTRIVAFSRGEATLAPLTSVNRCDPNAQLILRRREESLLASPQLLGTVVNAEARLMARLAQPDSRLAHLPIRRMQKHAPAPSPLSRSAIRTPFSTGLRAIDAFCTLGEGQRLAVFAEPGVGKTTLLSQIARHSSADVTVIGLIGERGREVQELVTEGLSTAALAKSVIVASTSDESPIMRVDAAFSAVTVAEYFRACGCSVLLQVDSLTRLFRALREVGLAAGEMPVRRGYPPSVFAVLPQLIERAGTGPVGSITALYSVLLSSDLDEDPMVEEVKGLTDGHLYLSREIAHRGRYPAVDLSRSLSRLQSGLIGVEERSAAATLRRLVGRIEQDRELILLGGKPDAELAQALALFDSLEEFLKQSDGERTELTQTFARLRRLAAQNG